MKILVLGSGGREHTFCWKLSQSPLCEQLFTAPGNAGTAQYGENIPVAITDFDAIRKICLQKKIDMVVVGPEDPLVTGIYDYFNKDASLKGIMITGPSASGARLEGSKAFAKAFMERHRIPTAAYGEFGEDSYDDGIEYIKSHKLPVVIKADGLAAGKGVLICNNLVEALGEYELMVQKSKFGEAGKKVVVEEFLDGIELSVFVLTDGKSYVLLPEAKDYKKIEEGDKGLNTGGMGAVSPVPFATDIFMEKVTRKIIEPTIRGLQQEGIDYKGFIFFGLIRVDDEPFVIEYNCRMGDPETEVVLLRLKNDLVKLLMATHHQTLSDEKIMISNQSATTVVAVSEGYPGPYQKGFPIEFAYLEDPGLVKHLREDGGVMVFHAGTRFEGKTVVTNGGRVLAVSAMADHLAEAVELSLDTLDKIYFQGKYYRTDIGYEFIS